MYQIPEGFGCVEDGIFRSAHINEASLMFLETLNLKSILYLNPESPTGAIKDFCTSTNITFHHHGLQPWRPASEWKYISINTYHDAIKIILDKTFHPILIVDASSMLVGVLRKLQHWAFSSVLAEYTALAGIRASYANELFLELIEPKCIIYDENTEQDEIDKSNPLSLHVLLPSKQDLPDWFLHQHKIWNELEKK